MATYNCVPASRTVPPCPSGTAPDVQVVTSGDVPENYVGYFDHIPVQDVLVGGLLVLAFLLGVMAGRR